MLQKMGLHKITKKLTRKSKILLNSILPSKPPEFGVFDVPNPIFFVYFLNGEIFFIANNDSHEFSEVVIDEIIKVGIHNDEFAFYPALADSAYFVKNFELDTFKFIELIEANNLNVIASAILSHISAFKSAILEHKMLYFGRLENAICNIAFSLHSPHLNAELKWACENAIKKRVLELMEANILDCDAKIFSMIFGDGIYEVEMLSENLIKQESLLNYYNTQNLATSVENHASFTLESCEFFITYFIDSLLLTQNLEARNVPKKLFANTCVSLVKLNMLGLPKLEYLNNDLRVSFCGTKIIISNLQNNANLTLHSLKSAIVFCGREITLEQNENIQIQSQIELENGVLLDNLHKFLRQKIHHSLMLTYTINGVKQRFLGNSNINLGDLWR